MDYKSFFDSDDYMMAKPAIKQDCDVRPAMPSEMHGCGCNSARSFNEPACEPCGEQNSPATNVKLTLDMPFDKEGLPLAMSYVPMQAWREIYETDKALSRATIFKELDKPFFKGGAR